MSNGDTELYCEDLAKLLADCEGNEPSDELLESIEDHVARCPVCRAAETLLASSIAEMHRHHEDQLSKEFEQRIIEYYCGASPNGRKPSSGHTQHHQG